MVLVSSKTAPQTRPAPSAVQGQAGGFQGPRPNPQLPSTRWAGPEGPSSLLEHQFQLHFGLLTPARGSHWISVLCPRAGVPGGGT